MIPTGGRPASNYDRMRDAIRQVTGRVYKLGPYKKQETAQPADPLEELAGRAEDAGIPVIRK